MQWDGMSIRLYSYTGIATYLHAPNKRKSQFKLSAVKGKNDTYNVTFPAGYMHDCWSTCKQLVFVDGVDPDPVTEFPQLDECKQAVLNEYNRLLQPLFGKLWATQTNIKRLEGVMDVPYQGGRQDVIRIVRLPNAVPLPNGQKEDLIVVSLSLLGGPLDENGGASGPPH